MTSNRLVAFSAYGRGGASTRVRLLDWLDHLGAHAEIHSYRGTSSNRPVDVARDPLGIARAEAALRRLDVSDAIVLLSREASPFSRGGLEEGLLRRASRGVFDLDDAIYLPVSGPRRLFDPAGKAARIAVAADVVIAGNDVLATWASAHNRDVRVIPSCIEPDDYAMKASWAIGEKPRLVWLGSPSTEQYLVPLLPALAELNARLGARLTIISGPAGNPALAAVDGMVDRVAWSPESTSTEVARADVAIAPLTDSPWSRGKCAYKLLQYAAAGLPIVGSPVGANSLALERFDGLAVTDHADWLEAIEGLVQEPVNRRQSRGKTARQAVTDHYSFSRWAEPWAEAAGVACR